MRNRFDHLAKQIGKEALGPSGATSVHDEISPETQHADLRHEPDPARKAERDRLGLLGRIASVLCLIEIYGHAPTAEEFRACLAKQLAFWSKRAREARAYNNKRRRDRQLPSTGFVDPTLWIIAAGSPTAILAKLKLKRAQGWPKGIYFFGDDVLRVGLVVASKLPRNRDTLLVRLMAAGPLLTPAIEDLADLPPKAHERAVAEHILLDLQHALKQQPSRTPTEREFIVTMRRSWEDARIEGSTTTQANAVLTVLRVRGIAVPAAARKRILAEKDLHRLEQWLEKASIATSIDGVIDGRAESRPSRAGRHAVPRERNGRRLARASAQR
jgi:hypothetical protein